MQMSSVDIETQFLYYQAYGCALYWIGDYVPAIEALQIARRYRAEDTDIYLHLGNALWQANRREEAMHTLRQGLENSSSSIELHYALGDYASKQGDFPAAANAYRALTLLNPNDSAAFYYLGVALYAQGEYKNAETVLEALQFTSERANQELQRMLLLVRKRSA